MANKKRILKLIEEKKMKLNVSVESPATNNPRKGRGFSRDELAAAKLSIEEAREAGLIVDLRRKSKYKENIESLKNFKLEYANYLAELEKDRIKVRKANAKARREALKKKKDEAKELVEREKEIEEEKLKVQEEIAQREAEELEAEPEELTEEELAELDELEEGLEAIEEETPEEALEKVEEDLAEALSEKEEKEVESVADGTKRVVKRVRKKPTTAAKGAADKAEKKE
jgi:ribosomal protein L13E